MESPARDLRLGSAGLLATALGWCAMSAMVHTASAPFLTSVLGASAVQVAGRAALWALAGVVVSLALVPAYRSLFADPAPTPLRIAAMLGLCALGGLAFSELFHLTDWPLPEPPRARPPRARWARALPNTLSLLVFSALLLASWNVTRLQQARERLLRAESSAIEARLAMLRLELDPHFLFNTLNSVIGTIDESPARAKRMVRQLAELLRHTLDQGAHEVPLEQELHTVGLYLDIERTRFEDRLAVHFDVDEAARRARVPTLLLQPLVENAVKHGWQTAPKVLEIGIAARLEGDRLCVEVSNTGRLQGTGHGIGLRNLRDRLAHVAPGADAFALSERDGRVIAFLRLPVRW